MRPPYIGEGEPHVSKSVGVLEPILRKDCLIRGSPRLKSRREIDKGIFIQVQAFSGENNNPTPVCVCICLRIGVTIREKQLRLVLPLIAYVARLCL